MLQDLPDDPVAAELDALPDDADATCAGTPAPL